MLRKGGGEMVVSAEMVSVMICKPYTVHTCNAHPPAGEDKVLLAPLESFARHCHVYQLYLHVRLQVPQLILSPFDTSTVNTITHNKSHGNHFCKDTPCCKMLIIVKYEIPAISCSSANLCSQVTMDT